MTQLLPIIAVIPPAERLHQGGQFAMPLGHINVCLKCGGETLGNTVPRGGCGMSGPTNTSLASVPRDAVASEATCPAAPEQGEGAGAAGKTTTIPIPMRDGGGTRGRGAATSTPVDPPVRVVRPRGAVTHLYTGRLCRSGRRAPRGARPACNTRCGVLWVEQTWGPLDPDSRRLCRRCAATSVRRGPAVPGRTSVVVAQPRDRVDFHRLAAAVTVHDLAVAAWLAETRAEVERVELLGLAKLGPRRIHTDVAVLPTPARPARTLWQWVDMARTRLDIHDPTVARDAAQRAENRVEGDLAARQMSRDSRAERAAEQRRSGRYVPNFLT